MKQKIYLVKSYLKFNDDENPTRLMRKRAFILYATETKEEAAADIRDYVEREKRETNYLFKRYWFIEEITLYKALSND